MEYTKDVIFNVRYNDVKTGINLKGRRWTSKIWKKIRNHKIMSLIISTTLVMIALDVALIYNFFTLLKGI